MGFPHFEQNMVVMGGLEVISYGFILSPQEILSIKKSPEDNLQEQPVVL